MRFGFTTGSCAAAAAKAAAFALLSGETLERIVIPTPKGIPFEAELLDWNIANDSVSCGVRKDGGDDPDVTTGLVVYAKVSKRDASPGTIAIEGGEGVGRVTKPGLDRNVGSAAINSAPLAQIESAVRGVCESFEYSGALAVTISVPGGEEIAKRTFNPRLGIVGGISILGTSGVVEPMSARAIVDTIRVELRQRRALGRRKIAIAPGNYGIDFIKSRLGLDLDRAVKCSNFIGETIDLAAELGFTDVLLCGALGKLIKVSGGIMNAHSREADCRMELMASAAIWSGVSLETARKILDCATTDEAYEHVVRENVQEAFIERVTSRIDYYLKKRAAERLNIEAVVFSERSGLLGLTPGAEAALKGIVEEGKNE